MNNEARRPASAGALILIVDDDASLLKLMKRDLEMEGYRVITAPDGKTGLRLLEDEEPDLLLLDLIMPGMDGFTVCQRAREFSSVPIIMLTAKGELESMVRGFETGADDYVVKPFGLDELLARVEAVLRRHKITGSTTRGDSPDK